MTMAFPESTDDRIQRALNEAKRAELAEKFGGMFIEGDHPLPPDIESEFLQRIEEFELKWAAHDVTTVRAFIGDPPVKPLDELAPDELEHELGHLMRTLEENDIEVDFCERPGDAEVYRFIVEELLDHEMDDIRVPGMVCHFVYEEFHPNHELDARFAGEWFLARLLTRSEYLATTLERTDMLDAEGSALDFRELRQRVCDFQERIATVIDHELAVTGCALEGNDGVVTLSASWTGLESGTMNQIVARGEARVMLRRGAFEEWEVVGFELPGAW
jgi:hypothetical protein